MIRTIASVLFFYMQIVHASGQPEWKLSAEKDEIKVYSKTVPDSKIKALKAECVLNATASELVALLLDVEAAEDWVFHTKSCDLIKQVSPSELYYYSEVSLPWPLENRDFVAHVKVSQNPVTGIVTVDAPAVPGWIAAKTGIVRISHSKGLWVITPLHHGKIKLEYTLQVDPGGIIPAWAVNMFAAQGPIDSFRNMKVLLTSSKYKNIRLSFIKE